MMAVFVVVVVVVVVAVVVVVVVVVDGAGAGGVGAVRGGNLFRVRRPNGEQYNLFQPFPQHLKVTLR